MKQTSQSLSTHLEVRSVIFSLYVLPCHKRRGAGLHRASNPNIARSTCETVDTTRLPEFRFARHECERKQKHQQRPILCNKTRWKKQNDNSLRCFLLPNTPWLAAKTCCGRIKEKSKKQTTNQKKKQNASQMIRWSAKKLQKSQEPCQHKSDWKEAS